MAATSQISRGGRIATTIGKRFFIPQQQIWNTTSTTSLNCSSRGVHTSVYDKNTDDQLRPTVVPDDVIEPLSEKYWGPHPHTGVFGPAATNGQAGGGGGEHKGGDGERDTVLEQQAWFRPLEDVEKPRQN